MTSNIQNSSGQTFSSWANLTVNKTVENETQEKEQKVQARYNNTWGSTAKTASLVSGLEAGGQKQRPTGRRVLVGKQAPQKDIWDRTVGKYLRGVEASEFNAFPYHNDSYKRQGVKAEKTKDVEQSIVLNNASGRQMTWGDFQQLGNQTASVGKKHVKKIENKNSHYLPVREIFEQYRDIRLVKSQYQGHLTYYIPCRVRKLSSNSSVQSGVLEVTLNKDTGKPHHVFFKTIRSGNGTTTFLKKRYRQVNGTKLSQMLPRLQQEHSEKFIVSNSGSRVQFLKV